jgi:hypothetical protein
MSVYENNAVNKWSLKRAVALGAEFLATGTEHSLALRLQPANLNLYDSE